MPILHKNINAEVDIHNPKWFPNANNGDVAWKNELGNLESTDELVLPAALDFVDASVAPPTTNAGDIYVLASGGSVEAGWGAVALDDWVRYDGTSWNSITPQKSSLCYDEDTDKLYSYDGADWVLVGGDSIYTASGTVPTSVVATLTDTLTFKGSNTSSASSNVKIVDSANASLWDFRNNGDIHIGKDTDWYIGGNDIDVIGSGSVTTQFLLRNTGSGARTRFGIVGDGSAVLEHGYYGSTATLAPYDSSYQGRFYLANGTNYRHIQYNSSSYELVTDNSTLSSPTVRMAMNASGEFNFGASSPTSGTKVYIEGKTAIEGADTLSTSTAFEIYDGDTTPTKLWDFRNNGDLYTNGSKGLSNTYTFGGGGSGDIASMTFTNGILTAVTTVP